MNPWKLLKNELAPITSYLKKDKLRKLDKHNLINVLEAKF